MLLLWLDERTQLADQRLALLERDKSGRLNGANQQLDLRCVEFVSPVYSHKNLKINKILFVMSTMHILPNPQYSTNTATSLPWVRYHTITLLFCPK